MQPLKDNVNGKFSDLEIAPLTVLADPKKLRKVLDGADSSADYIIYIQYKEADIILINKIDTLSENELNQLVKDTEKTFDNMVITVSAKDGTGISDWLKCISEFKSVGNTVAEVDYDRYAQGEADYGWLNTGYSIEKLTDNADENKKLAENLLFEFAKTFDNVTVGHIKFLLQDEKNLYIGNITDGSETPEVKAFSGGDGSFKLTVNARAELDPDTLYSKISDTVEKTFEGKKLTQQAKNLLIPGRPNPTYRYKNPV
jgi:G3E family GTPase